MGSLITANLTVAAFNVAVTIVILGLAIARIPPPNISGLSFAAIFFCLDITIWVGAYVYASGRA